MSDGLKVPTFDGAPEKLANYKDEALACTFTLEIHKRYLAGPRLAQSLTGVARTVIRRKLASDPQWLANPRGAYLLIDFLEQAIEQPTLVQASQHIHKFFYQLRRRRGESMTEWVNRHSESLWEASRALKRVEKEYVGVSAPISGVTSTTSQHGEGRNYDVDRWWNQHHNWNYEPKEWRDQDSRRGGDNVFDDDGRLQEDVEEDDEDHERWSQWGWQSQGWSWGGWSSWKTEEYQPPQSWETDVPDFLPDYLCGFLLLNRSGLDAHERANILAAIRGVFSVRSVERALKEQWRDEDLAKRDKMKYQVMTAVEENEEEDVLLADGEPPDFGEDKWAEDAYWADQALAESALAAIHEQRRTLKEARWRQSQVRAGRKFFPVSKGKGYSKGSDPRPNTKCLKCGGPHSTDNCPVKRASANVAEEHAEVAFSATNGSCEKCETPEISFAATSGLVDLPRTIREGKAVIDCGATATLGSVAALESLMTMNRLHHGEDRVSVDPDVRPVFKFGNNGTKSCMSTVALGVDIGQKKGNLQVHVHDVENQPILISVKALKALGAVLDFDRNEVIYRKVCPRSVVPLEAAANGHLLMPLGENLLKGAKVRHEPFSSLDSE